MGKMYDPANSTPALLGQVLVQPCDMAKVVVGMFKNGTTPPELYMEVSPRHATDGVTLTLAQVQGGDCYTLVCNIMNFGDKPCDIQLKNSLGLAV